MLGWIGIIVLANATVPQLEKVAETAAVQMTPDDAPSMIAIKRQGQLFEEFSSNSSVMLVIEGEQSLGADAHHYYDAIIAKLKADTTHVEHIQDFWGDRLTAAGCPESRRQVRLCADLHHAATRARRWPTNRSRRSSRPSRVSRRHRVSRLT